MPKETFKLENALYLLEKNLSELNPESPTFDDVCKEIKLSKVYNDPTCKVLINDNTIYFGHSFIEMTLFFPILKKLFGKGSIQRYMRNIDAMEEAMDSLTKQEWFSKYNRDYRYESGTIMSPTKPISQRRNEIISLAEKWQESINKEKEKKLDKNNIFEGSLASDKVTQSIELNDIPQLFVEYQGLVVGETHEQHYPKKVLIDNMKKFKDNGVEVIFLEHFFSNTQLDSFEYYFNSDGLTPPLTLLKYLNDLDNGFHLKPPYNFLGLVIQAKRYGIKIIPIDTDASYCLNPNRARSNHGDKDSRCLMMNFLAAQQKKEYLDANPEHKFIDFCGGMHVNASLSHVPGLQEITGSPVLIAQDSEQYNSVYETMSVDYMVTGNPELSQEAKDLNIILREVESKDENSLSSLEPEASNFLIYPNSTIFSVKNPQLANKSETTRLLISKSSHEDITPKRKSQCCSIS